MELTAKQKYEQSDKGKARKKKYRKDKGRHVTSAKYQAKPFIAVGSQSIMKSDGQLIYAHLALSNGKSITNVNGLTSKEVFGFLCSNTPTSDKATLVIYGSVFDFNQWISAADRETLESIYSSNFKTKPVPLGMYKVRLNKGQSFSVYDLFDETRTVNDVYNFFQKPQAETVEEYLSKSIRPGNAYQKAVPADQLQEATKTLQSELEVLAELMTDFRRRLDKVNLRPKLWSGAGSITTNLFERHNIKSFMAEQPADIKTAARYAYAGGRFEIIKYGSMKLNKSYSYDINSAYPEALTKLPNLAGGRWHHIAGDPGDTDFGLYKLSIRTNKRHYRPNPLFARDQLGNIFYPNNLDGWYWSPEVKAVREWAKLYDEHLEIDQAFIFEPADQTKPFEWVAALYEQRRILKENNDEAEVGLKLALNSAYGKLAQQVGWLPGDEETDPTTPSYHNLEWAGFVTSYTRAKIFTAVLENRQAVIAFETDCIYTSEEMDNIIIGDGLGEWRETVYSELTYLNSGIYFGKKENGEKVYKLRGIQAGTLDLEQIEETLNKSEPNRKINVKQLRFISASLALQNRAIDKWNTWLYENLEVKLYPSGKRSHFFCSCPDEENLALTRNFWHTTIPAKPFRGATQYCVEWINPDPDQIAQRNKTRLNNETIL